MSIWGVWSFWAGRFFIGTIKTSNPAKQAALESRGKGNNMNNVTLMGRLVRDPEVRYTQGEKATAIAKFTVAVDRPRSKDETDFISCTSFGKTAEFIEKYFRKGNRIALVGRIQTGSYTNKDGVKVYTTDVVAETVEFTESKSNGNAQTGTPDAAPAAAPAEDDGFTSIPDGIENELPFN